MTSSELLPRADLVAILDRAIDEPYGIAIKTTQPEELQAALDGARLPRHAGLVVAVSAIVEHVFVHKKGALSGRPTTPNEPKSL